MAATKNTKAFYNTEIPGDWDVKHFEDVADIDSDSLNGSTPKDYEFDYISLSDVDSDDFKIETTRQVFATAPSRARRIVKQGDILMSTVRPNLQGFSLIRNEVKDLIASTGFAVITTKKCSNEFLFQYLFSSGIERQFYQLLVGSNYPAINSSDVRKLKIPLPPLPEQKAIAQVLSTADAAIHSTEKLIAQKELRKKWLMQQLLTGKKRLKGFENTKWHLKSLEEIAEFKNGKAHENSIDENGEFIVVNSKFISSEGKVFKNSNDNLCPLFKDDIVMVMSDIPNGKALAKCFYVEEDGKYTLNQRICSIRACKNTDSKFLFFIINRNVHYLNFDNGVGQTNLKKEEVLECPLLIPEKEEQNAIAQVLQAADKEISLLKAKAEKLKEQKKGLMQVLLTGKIRLNYDSSDFYDSNENK
jgi:type I restriction enzyme S subunit